MSKVKLWLALLRDKRLGNRREHLALHNDRRAAGGIGVRSGTLGLASSQQGFVPRKNRGLLCE